jgi:hypothetical protein
MSKGIRPLLVCGCLVVGALLAAGGCNGNTTPCSGTSGNNACPPVDGTYTAKYTPQVACQLWVAHPLPTSPLTIVNNNGSVTVTLSPSLTEPSHTLTGTLTTDGTIIVTEPNTSSVLGIPFGRLTGAFTGINSSGQSPFIFNGNLKLTPTAAGGSDAGACNDSVTIEATENATAAVPDAGSVTPDAGVDGGLFPDGGH